MRLLMAATMTLVLWGQAVAAGASVAVACLALCMHPPTLT